MSRPPRRKQSRERQYRVEGVPRQNPDLHKLAQVFLGMAVARADADRPGSRAADQAEVEPGHEDTAELE